MAAYEILLDQNDHDYQLFGSTLNDATSSLLASIDKTAVTDYKYGDIVKRLYHSLNARYFPPNRNNLAVQTGRDVSLLIIEVRRDYAVHVVYIETV